MNMKYSTMKVAQSAFNKKYVQTNSSILCVHLLGVMFNVLTNCHCCPTRL